MSLKKCIDGLFRKKFNPPINRLIDGFFLELLPYIKKNPKIAKLYAGILAIGAAATISLVGNGVQNGLYFQKSYELHESEKRNVSAGRSLNPFFVAHQTSPELDHLKDLIAAYVGNAEKTEDFSKNVCQVYYLHDTADRFITCEKDIDECSFDISNYTGTGFFVTPNWVLTSYHIYQPKAEESFIIDKEYTVLAEDGTYLNADLAVYSARNDIALLYVRDSKLDIPTINIADNIAEDTDLFYHVIRTFTFPSLDVSQEDIKLKVERYPLDKIELDNIEMLLSNGNFIYDPLKFTGDHPLREGDSGTALINSKGEVQGVFMGTFFESGEYLFVQGVKEFLENYLTFELYIMKKEE